jgi:hypothetical protein
LKKQSQLSTFPAFRRVLVKALVIVAAINIALLVFRVNPVRALVTLNTWDLIGRGRARLAYPSDFQNGQLPLEALLATHQISVGAKPADEYRVILLGESGIAGWGVPDEDTLAAQLTERNIDVNDKRFVAYNLAYPQPGAARDLLIMDAAMIYDPDLILWFITPAALDNSPDIAGANRVFYNLNRDRLQRLVDEDPVLLGEWLDERGPALLDEPAPAERYIAIRDQDLLPVWLNALFYPFIAPDLAVSDRRAGSEPVPNEAKYTLDSPGFAEIPNQTWNFLEVGCLRAKDGGAAILLINEPMLVSDHAENYNANYQRALYDAYRAELSDYADTHHIPFADLWDIIPSERFTDTPLHMDAEGYAILSAALEQALIGKNLESSCSQ